MLTGTGKLYWKIDLLPGNKTLRSGCILVASSSPAGMKGCVITVTDPDQADKLVPEGIDLKVAHAGTPVEFTAGKVPNHEVYYATRVAQPSAALETVTVALGTHDEGVHEGRVIDIVEVPTNSHGTIQPDDASLGDAVVFRKSGVKPPTIFGPALNGKRVRFRMKPPAMILACDVEKI